MIQDCANPSFLTPFQCIQQYTKKRFKTVPVNRFDVYGCVYDHNYFLRPESLRGLGGKWRHKDPVSLHEHELVNYSGLDGEYQYLGHAFAAYGHFILESLPMLSHLLEDHVGVGIYLAWGTWGNRCRDLLDTVLTMLGLDQSSIIVHSGNKILKARMSIPSRPLRLSPSAASPRYELLDDHAYRSVIDRLVRSVHSTLGTDSSGRHSRLFLMRSAKRLPNDNLQDSLRTELEKQGFECIYPELLSFPEQVKTLASASVVAGFAGSQLHNAIFCHQDSLVIEIGDQRTPGQPLIFQRLCSDIARNTHRHVEYSDNALKIVHDIVQVLA
jgi:capsular polysaccharide biosynthesis protein